ncbi:ATP-binding protein [Methylobacterium organophilum]|uniref:histidine kinase n=1 Tax=Methylobacterium organophilum TaxID=410 RepID=A0ABQ4T1Y9_METOR|nr:ATP-binding protein [Methylobacterium organophilum]GJE25528.1 Sensor histidine kinase RcsC [Methylobacterium organophilum]
MSWRIGSVVAGAVLIALAAALGFTVWRDVDRYASDKRNELVNIARIYASAGAAAAQTADAASATAMLRAIGGQRGIEYAAILLADGSVLADQGLGARLDGDLDLDAETEIGPLRLLSTRTVRVRVPVTAGGIAVGSVVLMANTADLAERIRSAAITSGCAALLALTIGLMIAYRLQASLTGPLRALTATMETVHRTGDYAIRAEVTTQDEVGLLAETFNDLLAAVNQRDRMLAEHRRTLEAQVAARTAELSVAKDHAEAANRAKSTFLATMSHEIRTPMNGLLVMAELLVTSELPSRQKRYAEVIAQSGHSLLAILNDILDFAKVEAGKVSLEEVSFDPRDVADTVVTLFGERAHSKALDLAAVIEPGLPRRILGDPARLNQVIGNFVSNALKFTESGQVVLRVSCRSETGRIRFAVSDTGIGIPADKLGAIFEAFSQADSATTRRFGGTGLGLSIARQLVAAMGGAVGVESREGQGSTFWAEIPMRGAEPEEAPLPRAAGVTPAIRLAGLGAATEAALRVGLEAADFTIRPNAMAGPGPWIVSAAYLARLSARPEGAERVIALCPMGDAVGAEALHRGWADAVIRWPLAQSEWRPVLAALSAGASLDEAARPGAEAEALPSFAGLRVLVADDGLVNREVALEALRRLAVRDVTLVVDGLEAVERARREGFDAILIDGDMPNCDGFEASRRIRASEAAEGRPPVPIFALTAHVIGEAAEAWRAAGMDGVLTKPFTLARLAGILRQAETLRREDPVAAQAGAPEAAPLLDLATLHGLSAMTAPGEAPLIQRLLAIYRDQAAEALENLSAALEAGCPEEAARAAHALKSMSCNIGFARLAHALEAIEQAARSGAPIPDGPPVAALRALMAESIAALRESAYGPELRAA